MDINADVARIKQLEAEYQAAVAKYEADKAAQAAAEAAAQAAAQAAAEAQAEAAQAATQVAEETPVAAPSVPADDDNQSYESYMALKPFRVEAHAVAVSLANFSDKSHPTAQTLVARKSALAKII